MRYIRTKDGKIYELQKTKSGEKYLVKTNELIPEWNEAREVIKQADTIEELCDEAVVIDQSNYNKPVVILCGGNGKPFPTAKTFYPFATIYGAVWTDKGLIYRAKMNKKGELELL